MVGTISIFVQPQNVNLSHINLYITCIIANWTKEARVLEKMLKDQDCAQFSQDVSQTISADNQQFKVVF
jgi:hypothetical protein